MSLSRNTVSPFSSAFDDCFFDISHNNGIGLDFKKLADPKQGGRKGVIYKVTEGTSFVDKSFINYCNYAVNNGIKYHSVYHFAHHGNIAGQMAYFIDNYSKMAHGLGNKPKVIFMLDLERGANPPSDDDGYSMVQILIQKYDIYPLIYCGYDFWSSKYANNSTLKLCPHILASYTGHPISAIPWRIPSPSIYGFDLWQYTGDGLGPWAKDIPGGSHNMDLSCFNTAKNTAGLDATWNSWLKQTKQP